MIRNLKIIKTTPIFIVIWQVQKMQNVLTRFSHVWLFVTLWTVDHQAPLSMRFSRQKYWSGLPFPPPGDLPNTGIKPRSPALQADSVLSESLGLPHGKWILYCLSHQGSSNKLRWPGVKPRSTAWKAAMLTTIPPTPRHLKPGIFALKH